jgi:hypothetical protein
VVLAILVRRKFRSNLPPDQVRPPAVTSLLIAHDRTATTLTRSVGAVRARRNHQARRSMGISRGPKQSARRYSEGISSRASRYDANQIGFAVLVEHCGVVPRRRQLHPALPQPGPTPAATCARQGLGGSEQTGSAVVAKVKHPRIAIRFVHRSEEAARAPKPPNGLNRRSDRPHLLDANEWTRAFVAVYGVGLEGKPQANGLEPLASEGACLNYCKRTADDNSF